jgi:predicted permease
MRAPGFTLSAMLTLMLGIGGTTAVFTVVNGVLLRPLPYAHADRLVDLSHTLAVAGIAHVDQSDATYLVYRAGNRVFTDVGAYEATSANVLPSTAGGAGSGDAERVPSALMTAGVFRVLEVGPRAGRELSDADVQPGAAPVALIGESLWRRKFGGDPSVIGRPMRVDGVERTIVGVMPASFHFPEPATAIWLPLVIDPAHTASAAFDFRGLARLRDGVTLDAARADLQRLLPTVPVVYPGRLTVAAVGVTHMEPLVRPLRDVVVGDVGRVLWVVLGAAVVLSAIACANVANLFLARAEGRQRELAVRRALGAGRSSVLAEFLSEAGLIAAAGAALGIGCALAAVRVLAAAGAASSVPRLGDVRVDVLVVVVAVAAAALAACLVSLVPMARARALSLSAILGATGSGATGGRARSGARRGLVIAQVALALVLLAGAGLLARSFAALRAVDPGFTPDHALAFRVAMPNVEYPAAPDVARLVSQLSDSLAALPGVRAAGVVTKLPLMDEGHQDSAVFVEDHPLRPGTIPGIHSMAFVTPGYFPAMGIPLVAGRVFDRIDPSTDPAHRPREVVVSEPFAQRYWKGVSPVGRRIRMTGSDPWSTIVGVVAGVRDAGLDQPPAETVYMPLLTLNAAGMAWAPRDVAFVVRASGDEAGLIAPVRRIVGAVAPALPIYAVTPMRALVTRAEARTTFTLTILGIAALIAMCIGAVGIYGVIAYLVSLRTREIGVRMALGAQPAQVRRMITRHALVDAGIGIVVGLVSATLLTRVLGSVLFGVSPTDPIALGGAAAVLVATAIAASWIPARRAAALQPSIALRAE